MIFFLAGRIPWIFCGLLMRKTVTVFFMLIKNRSHFSSQKKSLALVIMTQQHSISLARNWNDGIKFIWKHLAWIFISGGKIYPKWGWPTSNSKRTCHGTSFFLSHLPLPFPKTKLPSPPPLRSRLPAPPPLHPPPHRRFCRLVRRSPPPRHRPVCRVPGSSSHGRGQPTRTRKPARARINNGHLSLSPPSASRPEAHAPSD
jgi:hypothetical protein